MRPSVMLPGIGDYREPEPERRIEEYDEDYDVRIDDMWSEWEDSND